MLTVSWGKFAIQTLATKWRKSRYYVWLIANIHVHLNVCTCYIWVLFTEYYAEVVRELIQIILSPGNIDCST